MHTPESELKDKLESARSQVQVQGRYSHYKNPDKYYTVVAIALIEATEEPCVVYRAEYGEGLTFVRPLADWLEMVDVEGVAVPRFSEVLS